MKTRTALLGAAAAVAMAPAAFAERGSDGHVNIIYWQAPSILNPYLSGGTKDIESASMIIEPLGRYDQNGNMVAYLAEEIPTVENGGVSEDLTSITWKLKPGLLWSDGTPVTSADVVFTAEYCMHPEGGCAQGAKFDGVASVEAIDDLTVKVTFTGPKPVPYGPFMGGQSPIIQKAQFADCLGANAPTCTDANFMPIGTGPFRVTDFKPNDVISMEANPNYRDPAKPAFATVTFKGGGDAAAAGRAVLETGEFDYAWNLQLAPDVLQGMVAAGKGEAMSAFGTLVERIEVNMTDPSPSLPEGERSTLMHPHPFLTDPAVRAALSKAIDRELLVEVGYGQAGRPTCNLVPNPALFASDNTDCLTQDIEGAKAMLEGGRLGRFERRRRAREGRGRASDALPDLHQRRAPGLPGAHQAVVGGDRLRGRAQERRRLGLLRRRPGQPGHLPEVLRGRGDVREQLRRDRPAVLPRGLPLRQRAEPGERLAGREHQPLLRPAYDALLDELGRTAVLEERGRIARALNDMLTKETNTIIPLVDRGRVSARSNTLGGVVLNTWDSELWNVADWYRIE
jgi:peptide/nickel transport system substrate-binding protein